MTFRLSHAALEDLQSIDDYTVQTWDAEQADRYLAMLWATFERIAKHPTRWRIRADLHPDCRICFSGRHAILYRLQDGAIEIARVLHDAMDFPVHASDLFPDHESPRPQRMPSQVPACRAIRRDAPDPPS